MAGAGSPKAGVAPQFGDDKKHPMTHSEHLEFDRRKPDATPTPGDIPPPKRSKQDWSKFKKDLS